MFASPFVAEPRAAQLADTQQGDTPQVPRRDDIGFSFTDEEYDAAVKQQGWDAQSSRRLLVLAQSAGVNMDAAADSGAAREARAISYFQGWIRPFQGYFENPRVLIPGVPPSNISTLQNDVSWLKE